MAYGENERKTYKGDWKCGKCGTAITELPFKPDPDRAGQLQCKDCFQKNRPKGGQRSEREMYKGNWKCGKCGTAITELPFEPNPDRAGQLQCRDCYRKSNSF